ncbi:MAG: hypothetical protein NXH95_13545 [Pseudomonadaceae bacterium]|nr:hypothetical protein [Pseudomonadaceae bacterium]
MRTDFSSMTREILNAYDISEATLAKMLGISQPRVHRIKKGDVKDPAFSVGKAINRLYDDRPMVTE